MTIIFLDFDGVLDTAFYDSQLERQGVSSCDESGRPIFDPECVGFLSTIIEKANASIVVSSDWKYYDSIDELRIMWNQRNMPGTLFDITPNINGIRGAEIKTWLDTHTDISNYVIIDDLGAENFFAEQLKHLVMVNPYSGIDDFVCNRAIQILSYNCDETL